MSRFFTPRSFAGWLGRPLAMMTAVSLVFSSVTLLAQAANPAANEEPTPQDVFAAIKAGDLEVGVVPQNERRLTIQMKNKTDRLLTIVLPPALAAGPILAQQPGGFFPGGLNQQGQNGQQQSPQQVGLGMNGGNGNNNNGGRQNLFGGMFNIPAGRAIKIKAETVCLEYGKPNPDVRMKYELKPLADVCDKPELAAVLTSLGRDQINQRSAQAAAWHLTNDLSWDELAKLIQRKVGSTVEMQFKPSEIAAAKAFVEKHQNSSSPECSLSETPKQPSKGATASASAWAGGGAGGFAFGNGGNGGSGGTAFGGKAFQGGFGGGGGGIGGLPGLPGGIGGGAGGFGGGGFAGGGGGGVIGGGGGGSANSSGNSQLPQR